MNKGAANIGVLITLGIFAISALVGTVSDMVSTRSIAVQAAADSKEALSESAENNKSIVGLQTNVEWIKKALEDNGMRPRYTVYASTSTQK